MADARQVSHRILPPVATLRSSSSLRVRSKGSRNFAELGCREVAEVLVEDAPALHEVTDLVHLDRHDLEGVLELAQGVVLAQVLGEPAQLLDVVADEWAAVDQQVGRLLGELGAESSELRMARRPASGLRRTGEVS